MSWDKWDAEHALRGEDVHRSLVQSRGALNSESAQRVRYHTGDGFSEMNRRLRAGSMSESDQRGADAMSRIIDRSRAQSDMILLHGRGHLDEVQPGDHIHEPGFLSTTTDDNMARNYAGVGPTNAILRVRLKQGESALSTHGLSDNPHEREVLLPRGQHYRVLKVQHVKGKFGQLTRLVDVEIAHHDTPGSNRMLVPGTRSGHRIAAQLSGTSR